MGESNNLPGWTCPATVSRAGVGEFPATTIPTVVNTRVRTAAGIAGRVLLGVLAAMVLAGVILVLLAYYTDLTFDIEAIVVTIVLAGVVVFFWTRWR